MELEISNYMLVKEAAMVWSVTKRRVIMYLAEERINGAVKIGGIWLIPKNTEKPMDSRRAKEKQC